MFGAPFYVKLNRQSQVKQKENIEKVLIAFEGNSFMLYLFLDRFIQNTLIYTMGVLRVYRS